MGEESSIGRSQKRGVRGQVGLSIRQEITHNTLQSLYFNPFPWVCERVCRIVHFVLISAHSRLSTEQPARPAKDVKPLSDRSAVHP